MNLPLSEIYVFAGFTLDLVAGRLFSDGQDVQLRPKSFALLKHLVRQAGRVVTRDELMTALWSDVTVTEDSLTQCVRDVRRALGDTEAAILRTVPRRGYLLDIEVKAPRDRPSGTPDKPTALASASEIVTEGRPVVAVLPLEVIGGEARDIRLARGMADQVAGMLGYTSHVAVIDTAASFAPALMHLEPARIGVSLSARYLVTGSLSVSDDALRVQIRLVDAENGRQVWARTFDGTREKVFDLQDRIVAAALAELEPHLIRNELRQSRFRHGTARAFDHYLRATDLLRSMDQTTIHEARAELEKAIAHYPNYAAHAMKAWTAAMMVSNGMDVDEEQEIASAKREITLGSLDCDALSMGGYACGFFSRDPELGLGVLESALALNPSSARAHDHTGWLLLHAGRSAEAARHFDRAIVLCPLDEFNFRMLTGRAYASLFDGDFVSAASMARRARAASPGYTVCQRVLIAALAHLGRTAETRAVAKDLYGVNPGFSIERYERISRLGFAADWDALFSGLRSAGVR